MPSAIPHQIEAERLVVRLEVGRCLGALAGEQRLREVVSEGGFSKIPPRRADAV